MSLLLLSMVYAPDPSKWGKAGPSGTNCALGGTNRDITGSIFVENASLTIPIGLEAIPGGNTLEKQNLSHPFCLCLGLVDGVIVVDLPLEEPFTHSFIHGLDCHSYHAPTYKFPALHIASHPL